MSDDHITPDLSLRSAGEKRASASPLKKIAAFGIFLAVAAGGVMLYVSQMRELPSDDTYTAGDEQVLSVDHYFENGTHTLKGILTVPTPCHEIVSQVTVMESYPEQVVIDLKEQGASDFCIQVITQMPFEVSFQASKDARISAKRNGKPIRLEMTERSSQEQARKSADNSTSVPSTTMPATTPAISESDDSFLYEGSAVE